MAKIQAIEGIGASYEAKLKEVGIEKVEQLLEAAATKKGRTKLSEDTGISEKLILTWVNHADLFRVKGIGPQYAELLEAAGVDSVPELANRNAANLLDKMKEINSSKELVRGLPALKQVENW
ncbi:MAG: DUF4332 domain-containing protein, partial [Clostridia bacterium]|nr:DUF4332 domain-containing protein [Clostridia bacterium]